MKKGILITAVLVLLFCPFGAKAKTVAKVLRVHDGDTVSVILHGKREKVRLIGIDAPELDQRPWGRRAARHLEKLLSTSKWSVSLEFDIERRDKHGRLLSYLWTFDRRLINLEMLKDGYAVLFTLPPNIKYVNELKKAQQEAKRRGLGIWGKNGLREMPGEYKKKKPI